MRTLFSILLILSFSPTLTFSAIIELASMESILPHLKEDTLCIFDIDNTIMRPTQQLGSDEWFEWRIRDYEQKGMESKTALKHALSDWMSIQNVTRVMPVEPSSIDIIQGLQTRGYCIMGLTTRGLGLSTRTIEQLEILGLSLNLTSPSSHELFLMNERGVLYREGILFTAATHKGKALIKFLHLLGMKPRHIVFINDKLSHLQEMQESCDSFDIDFLGIRYAGSDTFVQQFDPKVAKVQWEHFGSILSDLEAKKKLLEEENTK